MNYRFNPSFGMSLLALLVFVLFLTLGFWQISRAQEKKVIQKNQQIMATLSPLSWKPEMENPKPFRVVHVQGTYSTELFYLDNQYHQHRLGFNILNPLDLGNGQVILVDRGWIEGVPGTRELPSVKVPQGSVVLKGQTYYPAKNYMVLGENLEQKDSHLWVIEKIDTNLVSQVLHKSVYPFIIRLDESDPHGLVRQWITVTMSPERHYGYAVQWFAMALVILIIYIVLNLKKTDDKN